MDRAETELKQAGWEKKKNSGRALSLLAIQTPRSLEWTRGATLEAAADRNTQEKFTKCPHTD